MPSFLLSGNIDKYINKQINLLNIPSLGISIIENNKQTILKTYNLKENKETNNSNFVIGSLTKSFTALAIIQLIEQKKIELNAPIKTYLPWFRVKSIKNTELITVKSLLMQTSGFSAYEGLKNSARNTDLEDDIKALKNISLSSKPNEKFIYSNINYQILGLIIKETSGMSYSNYLKKNIFEPLSMKNTFTSKKEAKNLAKGYRTWFGINIEEKFDSNKSMLPAGYIISNIQDMSKYILMILNKGTYKGISLVSEESFSMIFKEAFPIIKDELSYSFGWFISNDKFGLKLNHQGAVENYMSSIILDPIKKDAILILHNKMTFTINAGKINDLPLNIMLKYKGLQTKENAFDIKEIIGYIILPLIFLIQVFFLFKFVKKIKEKKILLLKRLILPIFIDIIVILFLYILPSFFHLNLSAFKLFSPDLGYMIYSIYYLTFISIGLRCIYLIKYFKGVN
jgi:CubicO group peptidase (beta-lactamase class C family)